MKFSTKQHQAIASGQLKRQRLINVVDRAIDPNSLNQRHTYIFSPPGLGKSYTVEGTINAKGVRSFPITGATSMFMFGVSLAVIAYNTLHSKDTIIINVDDCDMLVKDPENCNILKNMLEGRKTYSYQKSMSSQLSSMGDDERDAVEYFTPSGRQGFEVPTDKFVFIITANTKLPTDDDVLEAKGKRQEMLAHKNAIRSRCKTIDFDLTMEDHWGWISDIVLNEKTSIDRFNLSMDDKMLILDWMYNNWDNMTERSFRVADKMAEDMDYDPEGYRDSWEIDYLKKVKNNVK